MTTPKHVRKNCTHWQHGCGLSIDLRIDKQNLSKIGDASTCGMHAAGDHMILIKSMLLLQLLLLNACWHTPRWRRARRRRARGRWTRGRRTRRRRARGRWTWRWRARRRRARWRWTRGRGASDINSLLTTIRIFLAIAPAHGCKGTQRQVNYHTLGAAETARMGADTAGAACGLTLDTTNPSWRPRSSVPWSSHTEQPMTQTKCREPEMDFRPVRFG